ncbi:MAG: endolytic transglycosylase MltG [Bacteroidota bacterium]
MKKKSTALLLFLFIAIAMLTWSVFGPTISNPNKKYLYIPKGSDLNQVKDSLSINEMVNPIFTFGLLSKLMKYENNIKPGKYKVTDGMSLFSLIRMLKNGRQAEVRLVITKLRTREDLAKKLSEKFDIEYSEALVYLNSNDSLKNLEVDTSTMMTLLIPNSYLFWWNTSLPDVLERLKKQHDYFWEGKRMTKARELGFTLEEIYTIASIVEE